MKENFILRKRTSTLPSLAASFTRIIYDTCLPNLIKCKPLEADSVPNDFLKALLGNFHDMMYLFFLLSYLQKAIRRERKHSITILHKNDNFIIVTNYIFIALACTIYKRFTNTLTSILVTFSKQQTKILHHN
jgi:hypothetical protein